METRVVQITLNGETRTVLIERYSPAHCWHVNDPAGAALCRFRTVAKLHLVRRPNVAEIAGQFRFSHAVVNNRHAQITQWADKVAPEMAGSGWTGKLN
jgi:hypothetical protein